MEFINVLKIKNFLNYVKKADTSQREIFDGQGAMMLSPCNSQEEASYQTG